MVHKTGQLNETIPVFELNLKPGQNLRESNFAHISQYHLLVVMTNSLENDYPSKKYETTVYKELKRALKKRSHVSLLIGGSKELFRVYNEMQGTWCIIGYQTIKLNQI